MTDNVHLKTNKYLEFTVQSYLGGLICFLTEGLNEITLPSGKKKKKRAAFQLEVHWTYFGQPFSESLPSCVGKLEPALSFSGFPLRVASPFRQLSAWVPNPAKHRVLPFPVFFSFFFSISLCYPFTPWSWNPSSPSSCSCPDLVIAFHFSPTLDLCPFASLIKHVFSWPCQPQGLTQAFIHTGQMMASLDIMSTHRAKRQNKMSSAKGERENRHPAFITLVWWSKSRLWLEITWPNISKSNTKLCHGNKMVESIWESQTTTSGKSCNYLQSKHGYYKGGEVVGKLALGIRPDMNSDSVALIINRVWKSRQVWTSTFTHLYFCVLPLTRKLCVVQMSRQNCLHVKICLKEKKKKLWFLGSGKVICRIKMI